MTVKGKKGIASIIGFIDVLIWFLIVKEAITTNETSILVAISYAGGYGAGTYIGTALSQKLISGNLGIQIITSNIEIADILRNRGYAVTIINAKGRDKIKRYMLFVEINAKKYNHLRKIIKAIDEKAFIVASETKYVQNGFITSPSK